LYWAGQLPSVLGFGLELGRWIERFYRLRSLSMSGKIVKRDDEMLKKTILIILGAFELV